MKVLHQSMLAVAVLVTASLALADEPIWTETFDDGVGLLDQTRGNGDSVFFWDAETQSIDGTFIRYVHNNPSVDRRYAALEETFDFHDSILGFSVVITPVSTTPGDNSAAIVGFFNSETDPEDDLVVVAFTKTGILAVGVEGHTDGCGPCSLPFNFGTTYFVEALLNGPGLSFSASIYEGTDSSGSFVGNIVQILSPDWDPIHLNALGLTNSQTGSVSSSVHALIHEISYTFQCVFDEASSDINQNSIPDECECLADLTDDGDVSASDLAILLGFWGVENPALGDLNADGEVNAFDLAILLGNWGSCQ